MLGQTYSINASKTEPFSSVKLSGPYYSQHLSGLCLCCALCGRFGHIRHKHLGEAVPAPLDGPRRPCCLASLPQSRSQRATCQLATSFKSNSQAMLKITTRQHATMPGLLSVVQRNDSTAPYTVHNNILVSKQEGKVSVRALSVYFVTG